MRIARFCTFEREGADSDRFTDRDCCLRTGLALMAVRMQDKAYEPSQKYKVRRADERFTSLYLF